MSTMATVTKKKKRVDFRDTPPLAMSIIEFCKAHRISVAFFYELDGKGEAPRTMRVGGRRLISIEEAARWREANTVSA
jgi:predicted DNA-binding transcriptional regulator AlpA